MDGGGTTAEELVLPRRPDAPPALVVPADLLVDALAALAAADSTADVAAACLPLLLELPGVRAVAVLVRDREDGLVVGSAGYPCGSMAPAARLPLDSGLPVTEALRTGRLVAQGPGPSWLALPFGSRTAPGALLLSLDVAPPAAATDLARLQRLARGLGAALQRGQVRERSSVDLAVVTAGLAPPALPDVPGLSVVVRQQPADGLVGGDAVLALPDGRGGSWLVAADVCGSGLAAAVVAQAVRTAVTTVAPYVDSPGDLLAALGRGLRPAVGPGSFVTAAVARVTAGEVHVASAGHPCPLLLRDGEVVALDAEPQPPLALEADAVRTAAATTAPLRDGDAVLLWTDGLTDRRAPAGSVQLDVAALAAGLPHDLDEAADHLLAAAARTGPTADDASLLLARPVAT